MACLPAGHRRLRSSSTGKVRRLLPQARPQHSVIALAAIQLTGGFSLLAGNTYGRVIGIIAASLGALSNLTSIGGNNPWWRLGAFALCIYILYGLIVFGHDVKEAKQAGQI
jgi:ABC-type microcin C transport system permease subunit YejE